MKLFYIFILIFYSSLNIASNSTEASWKSFEELIYQKKIDSTTSRKKRMLEKGLRGADANQKNHAYAEALAFCEIQQLRALSQDYQLKSISEEILAVTSAGGTYNDYAKTFKSAEKEWVVRSRYGFILPKKGSEDAAKRLEEIVDDTSNCIDKVFDVHKE